MDTNKVLRICGFACMACGIIIACIAFTQNDSLTYSKIIGPLQLVVGLLFLIASNKTSK